MQATRHPAPRGAPVHIDTHGYVLRSLTPADVTPRFVEWINDEVMREGLNLPPLNFTSEQLQGFVASFDDLHSHFIGIFANSGLLLGFYTIDVNRTHKVGSITTGLGEPEHLGKGVLWTTIDALLDHFYLYRDLEKMTARVLARNLRMLFNFRGDPRFKFEAKLSRECLGLDGKRLDVLVFASHKEP